MAQKMNKTTLAIMLQPVADAFVAATPADYYPCADARLAIEAVTVANPEYTGTVHRVGDEVIGKNATLTFNIMLRPPTGGVVPAANAYVPGRIMQAAKYTENRFSAGVAAEALGVGSTTNMAVLGATAAATIDLYKSMLISLTSTAATYTKRLCGVRSYSAAKNAVLCETLSALPTGTYSIPPQLAYQASLSDADPTKLSVSYWMDGLRYDLVNMVVSSLRISAPVSGRDSGENPTMQVTLSGRILQKADQTTPIITSLGPIPKFRDGKLFVANKALGGSSIDIDNGLRVAYPLNPNQQDGSDAGELVEVKKTVSLNLQATLKATFDSMALADAQAQHSVFALWGFGAGSAVALIVPDARFNYQSPSGGQDFYDEQGDMMIDVFDKNFALVFPF